MFLKFDNLYLHPRMKFWARPNVLLWVMLNQVSPPFPPATFSLCLNWPFSCPSPLALPTYCGASLSPPKPHISSLSCHTMPRKPDDRFPGQWIRSRMKGSRNNLEPFGWFVPRSFIAVSGPMESTSNIHKGPSHSSERGPGYQSLVIWCYGKTPFWTRVNTIYHS